MFEVQHFTLSVLENIGNNYLDSGQGAQKLKRFFAK